MSKLLNEWPVVWRRWNPTTETWSYHAEELKGLTCEPLYTAPPERTLRDHFAGMAMQSLYLSNTKWEATGEERDEESVALIKELACDAYHMADAMLAEREKKDE